MKALSMGLALAVCVARADDSWKRVIEISARSVEVRCKGSPLKKPYRLELGFREPGEKNKVNWREHLPLVTGNDSCLEAQKTLEGCLGDQGYARLRIDLQLWNPADPCAITRQVLVPAPHVFFSNAVQAECQFGGPYENPKRYRLVIRPVFPVHSPTLEHVETKDTYWRVFVGAAKEGSELCRARAAALNARLSELEERSVSFDYAQGIADPTKLIREVVSVQVAGAALAPAHPSAPTTQHSP